MPKKVYPFALTACIVDVGKGKKVLKIAKNVGVRGGTIIIGHGTIRHPLMQMLGITEAKKEMVLMVVQSTKVDALQERLDKELQLYRANHGITFTVGVRRISGIGQLADITPKEEDYFEGADTMPKKEIIFTIVDKGFGQDVVDAANKNGSTGATVINARGSGVHEHETFFALEIEPEKEIVMMIVDSEKVDGIIEMINKEFHLDQPGKGILFTIDAMRTAGLFQSE